MLLHFALCGLEVSGNLKSEWMVALSIRKLGQPERVNKEMYNSVRAASGILVLGQIKKSTAFGTPSHIHKCTHIHTHTHTHIHTHMHTYTHTHTHTHTHYKWYSFMASYTTQIITTSTPQTYHTTHTYLRQPHHITQKLVIQLAYSPLNMYVHTIHTLSHLGIVYTAMFWI